MSDSFFFDTYALISLINGNINYLEYSTKTAVINDFVFAEFCYNILKEKNKHTTSFINEIKPAIVHAEPDWIEEGMRFRIKWKDRSVSITDCVGYIMAKKLGIKFLTGDKEFEGMENVEFVK